MLSTEIRDVCRENEKYKEQLTREQKDNKAQQESLSGLSSENLLAKQREEGMSIKIESLTLKSQQLEALLGEYAKRGDAETNFKNSEKEKWRVTVELEKIKSELQWRIATETDFRLVLD